MFCIVSAAVAAEKKFSWRMAAAWGEGLKVLDSDRAFAKKVGEMSGGRLVIKVFPAGQIAPTSQILDMVRSGAVEVGSDWPGYWSGKNTAFDLLGSQLMGFTPMDQVIWMYAGGGMKFYDELFGRYGIKYFPHHLHDQESGFRTTRPIRTLKDFKGMKLRVGSHIPALLIQKFGAQPVTMPMDDVYEAVQRGVVDGCELNMAYMDYGTKIHEVAKWWLIPGWHQTASLHGILINQKKFDELPDDLKAIVAEAARSNLLENLAVTTLGSVRAIEDMSREGVQTTRTSEEDLATIERVKNEVLLEVSAKNPDFARLLQHQIDFDKRMAPYRVITAPWSFGRTWKSYPDLSGLKMD
jgi:TRAP-type mannitol/chloroaromatic compound transport system substrate-binding protein